MMTKFLLNVIKIVDLLMIALVNNQFQNVLYFLNLFFYSCGNRHPLEEVNSLHVNKTGRQREKYIFKRTTLNHNYPQIAIWKLYGRLLDHKLEQTVDSERQIRLARQYNLFITCYTWLRSMWVIITVWRLRGHSLYHQLEEVVDSSCLLYTTNHLIQTFDMYLWLTLTRRNDNYPFHKRGRTINILLINNLIMHIFLRKLIQTFISFIPLN